MFYLLTVIGLSYVANARAGYGDWTVYAAYHDATKVVEFNKLLYVLSDGGLYSYDPSDTDVRTYDKASLLSDNGIYDVVECKATNSLVIVYMNGNIDLLDVRGNIYNMPELKETTSLTDKTVNDLYVKADNVYISTNSGIIVLDTRRKVFANTYDFGHKVSCAIVDGGHIIAATPDGVYSGSLDANLLDAGSWVHKSSNVYDKIINFEGTYYVLTSRSLLGRISNKDTFTYTNLDDMKVVGYSIIDDHLYCFGDTKVLSIGKDAALAKIDNVGIKHAAYSAGTYWSACGASGMKGMKLTNGAFTESVGAIIPNSPVRNYVYQLKMYDGRLLAVGGCLEYPVVQHTFTVMQYENGIWTNFEEDALRAEIGDTYYRNAISIVQDPNDPAHHLVGASAGIFEFQDYKYSNHITYTNSPLTSILPNSQSAGFYVRMSGLAYDNNKNLWMCNNECDTIIRIRRPDGTWLAYYCDEIARHPIMGNIMFDRRGWAWINSRVSGTSNNGGIFVLDTNGTLNQRSDDKQKFIYIISNQDGTTYQFNNLNCIVEDLDGAIWVGSNYGPFVTYNPASIFNSDFTFTQPKVPRNDGTNYADYLLGEIEVRCMAVDGGNRKWFGTFGSGVYLTSADGSEIIEHFTTDNSPLISNDIYDIAIDGTSGEVYFATTEGLVSYTSNATDPAEQFDKDIVKVYPNPVRPDYQGKIIITGLMASSNVKIVNAAGRLIHEGTSVGGQYTWDGRNNDGRRAASGVYYVLATDEEGDSGVATKFLMVK